jgi:hypothetical protein
MAMACARLCVTTWAGAGELSRRLTAYASVATADYREPQLEKKFFGDGSISFLVNDTLRVGAGGGSIVMDAYPALHNQVTAPFGFGEFTARLTPRTQVAGRASRYTFSDDVVRTRADLQVIQTIAARPAIKVNLGGGSADCGTTLQPPTSGARLDSSPISR